MPHLRLEHTANIGSDVDDSALFADLHSVLHDVGKINKENCKARRYVAESFFIADGGDNEAFVHLDIRFVGGRSEDVKSRIGEQCLHVLKRAFDSSLQSHSVQITVEIRDIQLADYHKYPVGTLTKQP
ncbi:MAG: hypothetical protein AAF402_15705 [Pseudomonadota bacterium]